MILKLGLSWNVEGLKNCLNDEDFLNVVVNFDLVFCSETWQRKGESFELSGYECIDVPRKESVRGRKGMRGHGGVCLFIKHKVTAGVKILEMNQNGFG